MNMVEKGISFNKRKNTYVVVLGFAGDRTNTPFPTLEEARKYRDAVYDEMTKKKIELARNKIREKENDLINKEPIYPYNFLEQATGVFPTEREVESFLRNITDLFTNREQTFVELYYKDFKALKEIGIEYNLSRERVRQILGKASRKVKAKYLDFKKYLEFSLAQERLKLAREVWERWKEEHIEIPPVIEEEIKTDYYNNLTIEDLDLSVRSYNCLKRANIYTLLDLINKTEIDMMKVRNLGKKSLREVKQKLAEYGLAFKEEE